MGDFGLVLFRLILNLPYIPQNILDNISDIISDKLNICRYGRNHLVCV